MQLQAFDVDVYSVSIPSGSQHGSHVSMSRCVSYEYLLLQKLRR